MIKIMQGDYRDVLKTLPAGSINCLFAHREKREGDE